MLRTRSRGRTLHVDVPRSCATRSGLANVSFVLVVGDRYLHVLGATGHPHCPWTTQRARNLVVDLDEHFARFRFLVRDHAGAVRGVVRRSHGGGLHQGGQDPTALSASELLRRTLRSDSADEVTDRTLIFAEQHLRRVLAPRRFMLSRAAW
jgi:putative transposase